MLLSKAASIQVPTGQVLSRTASPGGAKDPAASHGLITTHPVRAHASTAQARGDTPDQPAPGQRLDSARSPPSPAGRLVSQDAGGDAHGSPQQSDVLAELSRASAHDEAARVREAEVMEATLQQVCCQVRWQFSEGAGAGSIQKGQAPVLGGAACMHAGVAVGP